MSIFAYVPSHSAMKWSLEGLYSIRHDTLRMLIWLIFLNYIELMIAEEVKLLLAPTKLYRSPRLNEGFSLQEVRWLAAVKFIKVDFHAFVKPVFFVFEA